MKIQTLINLSILFLLHFSEAQKVYSKWTFVTGQTGTNVVGNTNSTLGAANPGGRYYSAGALDTVNNQFIVIGGLGYDTAGTYGINSLTSTNHFR